MGGGTGKAAKPFCCRAGIETGGLVLGEQKEKRRSAGCLSSFLAVRVLTTRS